MGDKTLVDMLLKASNCEQINESDNSDFTAIFYAIKDSR